MNKKTNKPSCVSISSTSPTWTGVRLSCLIVSWSLTWFIVTPMLMVVLSAPGASWTAIAVEVTSPSNWGKSCWLSDVGNSSCWWSGRSVVCCWLSPTTIMESPWSAPVTGVSALASLLRPDGDVALPHDLLAIRPISAAVKCPRGLGGRPQHIFHLCVHSSKKSWSYVLAFLRPIVLNSIPRQDAQNCASSFHWFSLWKTILERFLHLEDRCVDRLMKHDSTD